MAISRLVNILIPIVPLQYGHFKIQFAVAKYLLMHFEWWNIVCLVLQLHERTYPAWFLTKFAEHSPQELFEMSGKYRLCSPLFINQNNIWPICFMLASFTSRNIRSSSFSPVIEIKRFRRAEYSLSARRVNLYCFMYKSVRPWLSVSSTKIRSFLVFKVWRALFKAIWAETKLSCFYKFIKILIFTKN